MKTKINRYYVGASHIAEAIAHGQNDLHTCPTLDKAIAQAKRKFETEDCNAVIVVQIVAVIEKKAQPLVVKMVR